VGRHGGEGQPYVFVSKFPRNYPSSLSLLALIWYRRCSRLAAPPGRSASGQYPHMNMTRAWAFAVEPSKTGASREWRGSREIVSQSHRLLYVHFNCRAVTAGSREPEGDSSNDTEAACGC
jgi:hypothetical protein